MLCISTSTEVKVRQNQDLARYRHFVPSSSREKKKPTSGPGSPPPEKSFMFIKQNVVKNRKKKKDTESQCSLTIHYYFTLSYVRPEVEETINQSLFLTSVQLPWIFRDMCSIPSV